MRTSILVASLGMLLLAGTPAASPGGAVVLKPDDLKAMGLDTMLSSGESYVKEMNDLVRGVLNELGSARDGKDFQRMNCLGDVLTTLKGLLRLSEQNAITLRERVIAKDRTGAEHEFVKLSIARNKVVELHAQDKGCGSGGTEKIGRAHV